MKKTLSHLITAILFISCISSVTAQKISEGKVTFKVTYPNSQTEQQAMTGTPSESIFYFKGGKTRTELKTSKGPAIYIEDAKTGNGTMLLDNSGNKYSAELSKEKIFGERFQQPKVNLTEETKMIAGYKCRKALVAARNTEESDWHEFEAWFTNDISAGNEFSSQVEGIDGFMMEYETQQHGTILKLTATKVEKIAVEDSKFAVPAGYKKVTEQDMRDTFRSDK